MKSSASRPLLTIESTSDEPFYRQIYHRVRASINQELLKPGDRLPSARQLAKELGLARGTIESAYALLSAEGYIQSQGQAGTRIAANVQPQPENKTQPQRAPTKAFGMHTPAILPLQMGLPAMDAFPRKIWARLGARYLRAMQPNDMKYPAQFGLPALRDAIAAYLHMARGIACTGAQVFITSGYRSTLQLIAHTLLKADDAVWVEDPGFPLTRQLLNNAQLRQVAVPVDAEGIQVHSGITLAKNARAAVVTPAHQSPLCVSLSLSRRLALLEWATQQKSWIIEDDYDGEYRYVSRPLPALKSLDTAGRVLYCGTFSKVLFPGIRLAYLVVPENEVQRFEQASLGFLEGMGEMNQAIVSAFMQEGHFSRHIHRMRKLYAERREHAAAGLNKILSQHLHIAPQPGGMHLVLRLHNGLNDVEIAARMRANGLYVHAISNWSSHASTERGLLVSFTNIESQAQAEKIGQKILGLL
ncbi:PLP-dependent aminotransferase family protein [Rouxiella badensis]|jgi:GntR family transcriptional regulator/MocR family aminotransferase|uniref:MocR-like pyridoxine biosynthesis transcription factor PdxR n=1 Tax=Rouxiella badensis TaxID=1646377 RepID=UPI003C5CB113